MPEKKLPGGAHNPFEPEKPSHEQRYWDIEAREFREKFPDAARQARAMERIAQLMGTIQKVWRGARQEKASSWLEVENALLGRAKPAQLLAILGTAQSVSAFEARLSQEFFLSRHKLQAQLLKREDFEAIDRALVAEDIVAEFNAERHFFGDLKMIVNARLVEKFGEMVARLNVGKDRQYARYRMRVALAAVGVRNATKAITKEAKDMRTRVIKGQISFRKWRERGKLDNYFLATQHFNLAKAEESLYDYLWQCTRDSQLRSFLSAMSREKARVKSRFLSEKTAGEKYFRKKRK